MKLQLPATSAVPVALAAASIALALLLVPGGGVTERPSGVAPALRLVAGDVAAVVKSPVRAVTRTHAQPAAAPPVAVAVLHEPAQRATAPAPSRAAVRHKAAHSHLATPVHVVPRAPAAATRPAPKVIAQPIKHVRGKAKALGHLHKTKEKGKALGHGPKVAPSQPLTHPAAVPHGPPAVPPGHVKNGKSVSDNAAANGRGGGR
jgi:hypothetical protein